MAFLRGLFGPPNVEELASRGDAEGLIKALGYKRDAGVREAAAEALVRMTTMAVEPLVLTLTDTDKETIRQAAAESLAKIGVPAVDPLIKTLGHQDRKVRQVATEVLGAIGAPAVEPLVSALTKPAGRKRSEGAAIALGMIGSELEDATLRGLIVDELADAGTYFGQNIPPATWPKGKGSYHDPKLELPCYRSLIQIGDVRALRLMALSGFGRGDIHQPAELVFRRIAEKADKRAVGSIIDILKSDLEQTGAYWKKATRRVAFEVLRNVTEESFGDEVAMWEQWWEEQQ